MLYKRINLLYHLFLDDEFGIVYVQKRTVHVQKQLRLEVWKQNVFLEINHGIPGDTEKPLAYVGRWQSIEEDKQSSPSVLPTYKNNFSQSLHQNRQIFLDWRVPTRAMNMMAQSDQVNIHLSSLLLP